MVVMRYYYVSIHRCRELICVYEFHVVKHLVHAFRLRMESRLGWVVNEESFSEESFSASY